MDTKMKALAFLAGIIIVAMSLIWSRDSSFSNVQESIIDSLVAERIGEYDQLRMEGIRETLIIRARNDSIIFVALNLLHTRLNRLEELR